MLYVLGAFIIALLLPLYIVVGALIVCGSGFPIIFRQKRIGLHGKVFVMYKFRTMVHRADAQQSAYSSENESSGPTFKIHNDPRFTRIGRVLSHTGVDELPQLFNVLRGEMALIGPRPLPVPEARKLKPWMRVRENVLPGIISPAILTGTYHKDFTAWMRRDVLYVQTKNLMGDIALFFRSFSFLGRLFIRSILGT